MGYRLGNTCVKYTEEDINLIREYAKKDGGIKKAARALGRSWENVQAKATQLRIREPAQQARHDRRAAIKAGKETAKL